jgi:hypothetical protein
VARDLRGTTDDAPVGWLNKDDAERSSAVAKSPVASAPTDRSEAGRSNDPFSFDGFGEEEPEGPDAPHVWVRLPADERPEGTDVIFDDHGRPVVVGTADAVAPGRVPRAPGLVKTGSRRSEDRDPTFDPEVFAAAVAERVVMRLTDQRVEVLRGRPDTGAMSNMTAVPGAAGPEAPPSKFMKVASYAARTGYSTRTIETFITEGLPTVGQRRLRRVDVEPADEWIRNRAAHERDDQDSVEREARDDARRGRSARRRGRT